MIPETSEIMLIGIIGSIIATTLSLTILNISMTHRLFRTGITPVLMATLLFSFSWITSLVYIITGTAVSWILELTIHLLFIGAIFILLSIFTYLIKIDEILFYMRGNKRTL
ncbi:hypothetical protein C5S39_07480 [Candidatus Methanophagaceae archaeon]|nr:hypothetical protein C5S39_07480 [Methanophagales archaeon]